MVDQSGMTNIPKLPPDLEPDESWKQNLKKEIEEGLQSMVDDAKRVLNDELQAAVVDPAKRELLSAQHHETMRNIRAIATAQFEEALNKERCLRCWSHGIETADDAFNDALVREQQSILDNIKKEESQSERTRSRARDANEEPSISATESFTELERPGQYPIQRPVDRQPYFPDGINGRRPSASSPPKMVPEIWKPTISPEEDAAASTPYAIGRRGSTASNTSTGSGAFRSSISSQVIPAASDDTGRTESRSHPSSASKLSSSQRSSISDDTNRADNRNYPPPLSGGRSIVTQRSFTMDEALHAEARSHPPHSANRQGASSWSPTAAEFNRADIREYHPPPTASRSMLNQWTPASNETGRADGWSHQPPGPTQRPLSRQRSFVGDDPYREGGTHQFPPASRSISSKRSFIVDESNRTDSRSYQPPTANGPVINKMPPVTEDIYREDSRKFPPPLSPSSTRPIANTKSISVDDPGPSPGRHTQTTARWQGVPRSPNEGSFGYGVSHSPQHVDEPPWKWQYPSSRSVPLANQAARYDTSEHASRRMTDAVEEEYESQSESESDGDYEHGSLRSTIDDIDIQTRKREEEVRRKEEEARLKEEVARKTVEEAKRKEEEAKLREEEARRKQEEARLIEEEATRKAEEARRKVEVARLKEEETRRREEEIRKREEEVRRREEELNRREEEARRKEQEKRQEEERKAREDEEKRKAEARLKEEENRRKEDEYRKRAAEAQRRAEERRQHDMGFDAHRTFSSSPPTATRLSGTSPPTSPDRSSASSSSRSSSGSTWSSSTHASSANRSSAASTPTGKPASTPTSGMGSFSSSGPSSFSTTNQSDQEREWARRQEELAKEQQEKFRREQEMLERERQAKASTAGRIPTKEEVIRLFATHERQWAMLPNQEELHWESFPWPMLKRADNPNDLSEGAIGAYVGSLFHPGDKSKSMKERIKDHLRRWHPDRFDTRLLPKVVEGERAMVKEGAGAVVRCLTNLLMSNTNVRDVFS